MDSQQTREKKCTSSATVNLLPTPLRPQCKGGDPRSSPCLLFLPSRHSRESLLSFRGRPRFRFPCLGSPFL